MSADMAPDNLNLLMAVLNKLKLCQCDLYLDASAYSTNQIASILYQHATNYSSLTVLVTEGHMSLPALTQLSHGISLSTSTSNYSAWLNKLMERMHTDYKEQQLLNTAIEKSLINRHLGHYFTLATDDKYVHQLHVEGFKQTVISADKVKTEVESMVKKERRIKEDKSHETEQPIPAKVPNDVASNNNSSVGKVFEKTFSKG